MEDVAGVGGTGRTVDQVHGQRTSVRKRRDLRHHGRPPSVHITRCGTAMDRGVGSALRIKKKTISSLPFFISYVIWSCVLIERTASGGWRPSSGPAVAPLYNNFSNILYIGELENIQTFSGMPPKPGSLGSQTPTSAIFSLCSDS